MTENPRVVAIVLTFNAPIELARCVTAIDAQQPQPDQLLIVDNDGGAPASDTVDGLSLSVPVEILRLADNTGPAGGHAAGLSWFLRSGEQPNAADPEGAGFDLAWVMDDDCEPQTGALAALLAESAATDTATDPIYPTWINTALDRATNYPAWCGFLIRRTTVEAVGVPRADFFWWMEDTEYLHWRIPEAGFEASRLEDAVVLHHQDRRVGVKPAWKFYYEVRNAVYFRLRIQRGRGRRFYRLARALAGAARGTLAGPERAKRSTMIARGLFDGLRGDLGVRPGLPPKQGVPQ